MDYEEIAAVGKRKVNFSVYLPMSLVNLIDRIADAENQSAQFVTQRLLRKGLEVERNERAAKFAVTSAR